jgi:hypothetical protein
MLKLVKRSLTLTFGLFAVVYPQMMSQLRKFFEVTGDQILSTVLLVFLVFCLVQGVVALIESPPDPLVMGIIMGVGFLLGALKFFTDDKLDTKTRKNDDVED